MYVATAILTLAVAVATWRIEKALLAANDYLNSIDHFSANVSSHTSTLEGAVTLDGQRLRVLRVVVSPR